MTETATWANAEDRAAYERDGVVVIRNAFSSHWVEKMRAAIAAMPAEHAMHSIWMAKFNPEFDAFMRHSGLGELAGQLMGVDRVSFLYDQLFVRAAESDIRTPLHQDLPYWPVQGNDIISIWASLDHVTRDSSVVQYIKGSHRWGRMFEPAPFGKDMDRAAKLGSSGYEVIDDPESLIAENDVLWWEMGPGDVLAHHPLTLHFATPNRSKATTRRAVAVRYVGPDARLIDRAGNFTRAPMRPDYWPPAVVDGATLDEPHYPVVWSRA